MDAREIGVNGKMWEAVNYRASMVPAANMCMRKPRIWPATVGNLTN